MRPAALLPKLVRGRLKLQLAIGSLLVLGVGYLLAPPASRPEAPPEKVAPILEAQVQQRQPARAFRGVQDIGHRALAHAVSFPGPSRPEATRTHADFTSTPLETPLPIGVGVVVSAQGEVLTHIRAVSEDLTPVAQLADGRVLSGQVKVYEPQSGLVLVQLGAGAEIAVASLAKAPPEPGELAVAAARIEGRDFVAPVFVATAAGDRYTLSAASGVVVPGTPVFNVAGELIAVAAGSPSASVAHAAAPALRRLAELAAGGRGLPRSLGLSLQPLAGALAARLGAAGVLVSDVEDDGPAVVAGLRPGDVLESVAGSAVSAVEQAQGLIAATEEAPLVRWRRAGRVHERRVASRLAFAPPAPGSRTVTGPAARAVFPFSSLAAAGIGPDARVVSIEGVSVGSEAVARRLLRRRRPPWLAYLQEDGRRYFALVARVGT